MILRRRRRTLIVILIPILIFWGFLHYPSEKSSTRYLSVYEQIHRDDHRSVQPKSCFTRINQRNIRRAIAVHFPVERSFIYISELKWLYLSWIEIIREQPTDWQTDLVIFGLPSPVLDELGCLESNDRSGKNQCFRIHYRSLWDREKNESDLVELIQRKLPIWTRHLDSLGILLENEEILNEYDYLLRTDIDVFLTPHFAKYIPFDCSFQTGAGGYTLDYTTHKLSRIAQTLNLFDVNRTDIGSTWYAPPKQAVLVARLALWLSIWLSENEFTPVEKDHRLSILSWPQWYFGVLSMYAGHLAINHYAGRGQINLIQKPHAIDYSCTVNTSFHTEEIIHIHAWHTNDMFSKFLFKNGSYDSILEKKTVWNTNYSLDFILRIAWKSKQMSTKELYQLKSTS